MKTKYLLASIFFLGKITAQQTSFSLQQSLEYAYAHNPSQLNAELDVKNTLFYKKQLTGLGLPQIGSSLDVKDFVQLPTSLIPAAAFGGPQGVLLPVKFGVKWNATANIGVSQLIFSTDYFLGLQAARELISLSEKNMLRTKSETAQNVSKAYYSVLINGTRIKLLDANIARLKKMFDDTKALNLAGFVEKIDVDRLEVAYNNLASEKEKITRLIGLSEVVLKFQMGYNVSEAIVLTDSISEVDVNPISVNSNQKIVYSLRPEYSLLQAQQRLNFLSLKRSRLSGVPTIVGYGSFSEQAQRQEFNFFDGSQKWYPIGLVGATMNMPLFSGFQNKYRMKQQEITILKTKNNIFNLEQAIEMEVNVASVSYQNALTSLESQRKNMTLAKNVLEVSNKKYEQGLGSNLEIINAQTALKEAETNYINSLYDLYIAKTDYLKAIGSIVK